jgi:putative ABC transport system permease protein
MALRNLSAHRLRSMLTTLGIIVGVFSVIAVVSLMRAAESRLLHDLGADKARVFGLSPWTLALNKTPGRVRRFTLEELAELKARVPQIQFLSPSVRLGRMPVKTGSRQINGDVQGMDEHGLDLGNLVIAHGRNFTPADRILGRPLVILGPSAATDLGLGPKDLGKSLTIGGQTAELAGILERISGPLGRLTDRTVAVPYGSFRGLGAPDLLGNTRWRLSMDETLPLPVAKERLIEALRRVRGLKSTDPENFTLRSN